jgi:hypothetical protein
MSEGRVRATIEQMEAWLADPGWEPDAEALARWNAEFQGALAQKGKGPGWLDLVARAHAQVRVELETQVRGNRALKGYGAGRR